MAPVKKGERRPGAALRVVPDTPPAPVPADHPDNFTDDDLAALTEVLDSHVAFTGTLSKLAFAARTSNLEVTFTIPSESPITNRDLLHLRHRISTIVITPATRSAIPGASGGSALQDPVTASVTAARLERAVTSWLTSAPYDMDSEPS